MTTSQLSNLQDGTALMCDNEPVIFRGMGLGHCYLEISARRTIRWHRPDALRFPTTEELSKYFKAV